jgi:hypothetical protein
LLPEFDNIDLELNEKLRNLIPNFIISLKKYSFDNPVLSSKIEQGLKLQGTEVRTIIKALRRSHYPVGSKGKGYYWIKDESELEKTLEHLKARRDSLEQTIRDMEIINLNIEIKQGELFYEK